jgi:hypothetical protein
MKKFLFLSLFISFKMFGQAVTIVPSSTNNTEFLKINKNGIGLDHRTPNGLVGVGTYANANGGFIQTHTNHPLYFGTNNSGIQMTLNTNGYLGIGFGVSTLPDKILDVNGRMRIRHNGSTAGLWMSNSTNGLSDADGAFFGMENDNKAGIWINNAWRFGVNNTGEISTTSMVGSGYRMVLASPNGVLLSNFQPQVWSISASAFTSTTTGSAQFVKSLTSVYFSSGSSIMVAPVNLPTGVNITEIAVFYSNSDPTNTLNVRLEALVLANSNIGGVNTPTVATKSLGTVTGIQSATLTIVSGENLIDNTNRAYYLRVSSNAWSNNMAIYGIKITYSY